MLSRRIFAAFAVLCALALPAHAQKTKTQLNTEIGTNFPDNTVGQITPQNLRTVANDIVNSILPTAPVTNSGSVCFDGTTGLMKGCSTLTIVPTPNTTAQGLVVNQTLPSGSAGINNPYSANYLSIINGGYQTPPGGTADPFGLFPVVSGFRVDYQSAGSGAGQFPIQIGGLFATKATSRGQQLVGLNGTIYTNIDSAGEDAFWPVIGYANVGPAANIKSVYGIDAEVATSGSATIINRIGVMSTSQGAGKGSAIDAAFGITALDDKYGAPLPFNNGMVLWTSDGVNPPLGPAGSLIIANATFSMGYGINLPNVTFVTKIFDFGSTKFQMDGSGNTTIGATTLGLGTNTFSVGGTAAVQSTSGAAFKIGPNGGTNPVFNVDASTASQAAGLNIVGAATGGTVALAAIDSGSNASLSISPKGSGTVTVSSLRATSAVLTTPNLGTPSAVTLTNGTGLPTTGLTGTLQAAQEPAHTGGCTNSAGSLALSCTNNSSIIGGGATNTILAGATGWVGVGLICNATESFCYLPQPQAGTISNLYVNVGAAPGAAQTYTVTMRKNASNQTITCTISGASATSCNDTTHSFAVAAADNVSVQITSSGAAATISVANFGFKLATTSP